MANKATTNHNTVEADSDVAFLSVSGIPDEAEEDDIEHSFSKKKYGGTKVKVLYYDESNNTAVVSIKYSDKIKGTLYIYIANYI